MLTPDVEKAVRARIARIPIVETLRLEVLLLDAGVCDVRVPRQRAYDGIYESFHGGLLMTVADTAACFAALTRAGADAHMTTTDMNIRFLAPCLTDLVARARVIKFGRTLCPVAAELYDVNGAHVALAQVTYFLIERIPHRDGLNEGTSRQS